MASHERLTIQPVSRPIQAAVRVPGSKSFSIRALAIAGFASGSSRLTGLLDSEDTRVMIDSLARLGIEVTNDPRTKTAIVRGCVGSGTRAAADLYLANSGASIRFLTALVATLRGTFALDGVARMRQRPIGDLIAALRSVRVDISTTTGGDCPPVLVRAAGLPGGRIHVRGDASSQFLSALLIAAPLASGPLEIIVEGPLVSVPYVDMTLSCISAFGGTFHRDGHSRFSFTPRPYRAADYAIEPDASAASYFFAAAAITGGTVTVEGLGAKSLQGDLGFVDLLASMGCQVTKTDMTTTVSGGPLTGIDADMRDVSDTAPTLAAVACFANSPTRIRNVAHMRKKETDRVHALVTELSKTGLAIEEHEDGLTIHPGTALGTAFDTYEDHRMAMSLSLLGLRTPGVIIRDPACVAKTYPEYFADLAAIVS